MRPQDRRSRATATPARRSDRRGGLPAHFGLGCLFKVRRKGFSISWSRTSPVPPFPSLDGFPCFLWDSKLLLRRIVCRSWAGVPVHVITLYSRCVTPGASTARTCSSSISAPPRLSKRRAPSPSSTGTTWSSSRPAHRHRRRDPGRAVWRGSRTIGVPSLVRIRRISRQSPRAYHRGTPRCSSRPFRSARSTSLAARWPQQSSSVVAVGVRSATQTAPAGRRGSRSSKPTVRGARSPRSQRPAAC